VSASVYKPRVAFQGEHGAFSEDAAIRLFGPEVSNSIDLEPCPTFEALFNVIDAGHAEYILVPIENSLIGPIQPAVDLFEKSSLAVVGEVAIPIRHHLIGCPGSVFAEIEAVESHPAALAQCKNFLAAQPQIKVIPTDDTAGSVAQVIKRGDRKHAAIAGRRTAELYGGSIIRSNLEDHPDNHTRFLLLAREAHGKPNVLSRDSVGRPIQNPDESG
jgi:prephenate dehydratase